ncbi:MAG: MerR family transcriptional regulator [Pseudonocardiaceae bacterium]
MRMSELSRRGGVPVPTIKYYLREGLLPPGLPTAATQADYDEEHVRRLRLIRALVEVGGLSLAGVRAILTTVDDDTAGLHQVLGQVHYALSGAAKTVANAAANTASGAATNAGEDPDWAVACAQVDTLLDELDWQVSRRAPARDQLARALTALRQLDAAPTVEQLRPYASAAHTLAAHELALLVPKGGPAVSTAELVQRAVIGTVLYEPVLLALRRLAEEHESARRLQPSTAIHDETFPRAGGSGAG